MHLPHEHDFPLRYVVAPEIIGTLEAVRFQAVRAYGTVVVDEAGGEFDIAVGAIVWATGRKPDEASRFTAYGFALF